MKILFFTTYYPPFLSYLDRKYNYFEGINFSQTLEVFLNQHFGDTGAAYAHAGECFADTFLIICNSTTLQKKWAVENNVSWKNNSWQKDIALAQIKKFKPDVFYIESVFDFFDDFLIEAKKYCKLIISWISCPLPNNLSLQGIDHVISSTMNYVMKFRELGFNSSYFLPAFDARILKKITDHNKVINVSFVGGWSNIHINRKNALFQLAQSGLIDIWGYGYIHQSKSLFKKLFFRQKDSIDSSILKCYRGEAWGLEMYQILAHSIMTFNIHEDLLKGSVGNMRMFEATGMGSLLINDSGHNLAKLFTPEQEIEVYNSIPEAIEKINYYILNKDKAIEIGKRAQKRVLLEYNYSNWISQLYDLCCKLIK